MTSLELLKVRCQYVGFRVVTMSSEKEGARRVAGVH